MDYGIEIDESKLRVLGDHSGPGKISCSLFYKDFKVTDFDLLICQDGSFRFDVPHMKASSVYDADYVIWMIETAFFDNPEDELVTEFLSAQLTSTIENLEEL